MLPVALDGLSDPRTEHKAHHIALHRASNDVIDVRRWGAAGNGTTDDTSALQAALVAGAGRAVYIPAGTYKIASSLIVSPKTYVWGDGPFASLLSTTAPIPMITLSDVGGNQGFVTLRRVGLRGNSVATQGILFSCASHNRLEEIRINQCDVGIEMVNAAWVNWLTDCDASYGRIGLRMDDANGQINANIIHHCQFNINAEYGMVSLGGTSNRVQYCAFQVNILGGVVQSRGGNVPTFAFNHFESNGTREQRGIHITLGDDNPVYDVRNPIVMGNYFWGGYSVAMGAAGDTAHALRIIRTTNALALGNYAYGHRDGALDVYPGMTLTDLANQWT